MPEQLLTILKFCLLVLLYLFFLRVLRAVWAEVNGPKVVEAPAWRARRRARPLSSRATGGAGGLRMIEPPEQRGRHYPLKDELTLGRAAGCHITLDDTYISQMHARVYSREGQVFVEDLGSTNGTYLNRSKVNGPTPVGPGDHIQVGSTVMELT